MLLAVFFSIWEIGRLLGHPLPEIWAEVKAKGLNQIFTTGPLGFWKSFLSGFFICIGMTGLDQDLMQKNLSMKNISDARKNMLSFSLISFLVNLLFLGFGAFLALFIAQKGMVLSSPDLNYGEVAMHYFTAPGAIIFIIGLVSISFSSSDSALTALTTSFCIDILGFSPSDPSKVGTRRWVHLGFCILSFFLIIWLFKGFNSSVINIVYAIGSYTYGPLIGIYAFGLFIKRKVEDIIVPLVALFSALIIIVLNAWVGYENILQGMGKIPYSQWVLLALGSKIGNLYTNGWGNEIIIYNAGLTFIGLSAFSRRDKDFKSI
jgi:Na+/proline symporter